MLTRFSGPTKEEIMQLVTVKMEIPEGANLILGHSHFIKTVEDLYEILVGTVPGVKFGLAFSEASGECLIRVESNDPELEAVAILNAQNLAAGHTFNLLIKDAFPINLLNAIKMCPEVCRIICATANPVEVILAETELGRGILGVVDGFSPKGVEAEHGRAWRYEFLRKIGYKK
jgi:adenosine/AMP kinase